MDQIDALNRLLTGKQHAKPRSTVQPMEGVVLDVDGSSALVVIPEYDPGTRFGPMPFGRTDTPPQVGDRCIVTFIGAGIDRPFLTWWAAPE